MFLHLLPNCCVKMKLIRRVMHEWAHIVGKIVTFQKSQKSFLGSVKRDFGAFCFWCMFQCCCCCCCLSSIVWPPHTMTIFMFFSRLGEHNFRDKIAMFNPPKIAKSIQFIERIDISCCYQHVSSHVVWTQEVVVVSWLSEHTLNMKQEMLKCTVNVA